MSFRRTALNIRRWLCSALLALTLPAQAPADDWRILERDPSALIQENTATVENDDGYRFSIRRGADLRITGIFELRVGFDVFPDDGCPTLQIDDKPPIDLFISSQSCIVNGNRIEFAIGDIDSGEIDAPILNQLMYGNTAYLSFPLKDVGYRRTGFSLNHSRQVLAELLGPDVTVVNH
jgi:hypothetical protein